MLYHSNSPLIIFCHFLINSVMKPLSPKMTEINQGFFPFFPKISNSKNQKPRLNLEIVERQKLIARPAGSRK